MSKQKSLVLHEYNKLPVYEQTDVPVPKQGQLLVKVEGSTINPSDKMRIQGLYSDSPLPAVVGIEGTGTVIEANGADLQHFVGKRVSFIGQTGTWAEYALASPKSSFIIDADVPAHCAASGIINPLTVVVFVEIFKTYKHGKGLIHTAAASALGRMLNKLCQSENIPLLNIVRRQQHADILKSEGAKHIIITDEKGEWVKQYQQAIKEHGFNVLFDALGGGPTTEQLIVNLPKHGYAYIYGNLEKKPLTITQGLALSKGISISGFGILIWYNDDVDEERQKRIRANYSHWLKNQLSTSLQKQVKFEHFEEAWELSGAKATNGKVLLLP